MSSSVSSLPATTAGQPPVMRLASDRHFKASVNLSTWAIARRLPFTLAQAARLGRRTDRRAVLTLLACQTGAAALTATALAATTRVLSAVFTGPDVAAGLRENLTAVVFLALAACGRYLLDAAARGAAARLAPKAVREADLEVITAATAAALGRVSSRDQSSGFGPMTGHDPVDRFV